MGLKIKKVYKTTKKGLFKLRDVRFSICLGHDLLYIFPFDVEFFFVLIKTKIETKILLFELWAHDI